MHAFNFFMYWFLLFGVICFCLRCVRRKRTIPFFWRWRNGLEAPRVAGDGGSSDASLLWYSWYSYLLFVRFCDERLKTLASSSLLCLFACLLAPFNDDYLRCLFACLLLSWLASVWLFDDVGWLIVSLLAAFPLLALCLMMNFPVLKKFG